ncbi:hypothetical protein ACS2TL_26915, partial [Bacillus cereus group sp. BC326]|uniref:hypothetical protein n=1 Tax=Bacillus cereus group sp. BC326 TaxID=3445310 RepID=UPI003F2257D2
RGMFTINGYIPTNILSELPVQSKNEDGSIKNSILSFKDYVEDMVYGFSDPSIINYYTDNVLDDIFQNNWNNPQYVQQVPMTIRKFIDGEEET